MGTLIYNGVEVSHCRTDSFQQEVVYEDSGTDVLYNKYTITVEGVVSRWPTGESAPDFPQSEYDENGFKADITFLAANGGFLGGGATGLADASRLLRHYLETPRRTLLYAFDADDTFDLVFAPHTIPAPGVQFGPPAGLPAGYPVMYDVQNGPKSQNVSVVNITQKTFMVRFTITACVCDCPNLGGGTAENERDFNAVSPVLSNRWTEAVEIDSGFLTKRTRTGILRVKSGSYVDALRHVVAPMIPNGFTRELSRYEVQADGLALSYTFTDQERGAVMPPPGATKADGEFVVTMQNGAKQHARCTCTLTGHNQYRKDLLIGVALAVASQKLRDAAGGNAYLGFVTGSIKEELYGNRISVTLEAMLIGKRAAIVADPPEKKNAPPANPPAANQLGGFWNGVFGGVVGGPFGGGAIGGAVGGINGLINNPGVILDGIEIFGGPFGWIPKAIARPGEPPPRLLIPRIEAKAFAIPPWGSENYIPPDPGLRGTAGLILVAAALRDPCLSSSFDPPPVVGTFQRAANDRPAADLARQFANNGLPAGLRANAPSGSGQPRVEGGSVVAPVPANVAVVATVADLPTYSTDKPDGVYTHYELNVTYHRTRAEIAAALGRSRNSVTKLAWKMGLSVTKAARAGRTRVGGWTQADRDRLRGLLLDGRTHAAIADAIGRTRKAVEKAVQKYRMTGLQPKAGLQSRATKGSVTRSERLQSLFAAGANTADMAADLGVHPTTVSKWLGRLGLRLRSVIVSPEQMAARQAQSVAFCAAYGLPPEIGVRGTLILLTLLDGPQTLVQIKRGIGLAAFNFPRHRPTPSHREVSSLRLLKEYGLIAKERARTPRYWLTDHALSCLESASAQEEPSWPTSHPK